ncbi:MAG: protein kinase, partial [Deltaproteobacteria bacterium]|nr:protein kinase [Deltaproteobacteria bacterium]
MAFCPVCRNEYPDDWKRCPTDEAVLLGGPAIGKYRIETMIGSGGMGSVYRATNPDTGAAVAVKLLHPSASASTDVRARFRREAASVSKLRTRHVVGVYDFGSDGDTLFLVMEFLEGHPLRSEIAAASKATPMPGPRVHQAFDGALRGLAAAHKAGVTHRDLKPENIFIADTDDGEVSKVLDFGIARVEDTNLTNSGTIMGTPAYMAPEQVAGDTSRLGPWTDCYAMGVILYEMLTCEAPFYAETITAVLARIMAREFRSLRELRPDLPEGIYQLVERALAGDIEVRFQSAVEMREAWSRAIAGAPSFSGPAQPFTAVINTDGEPSREEIEQLGTLAAAADGPAPGPPARTTRPSRPAPIREVNQQGADQAATPLAPGPGPAQPSQPIVQPFRETPMATSGGSASDSSKSSKLPLALAGLVLVGGGIGAMVALSGGDDEPSSGTEGEVVRIDAAAVEVATVDAAPPEPPADAAIGPSVPEDMVAFAGGKFKMGSPARFAKMPDADPKRTVTVQPFYLDKLEATDSTGIPLRGVQWPEAAAACKKLGKRLPTEGEWEFAATRDQLDPNEAALGRKAPAKAGAHPGDCTKEGVCDLLGNVLEWTASDFRDAGKVVKGKKTIRGSSFGASADGSFFSSVHA